jgi:hypothetical protein
MTTQEFLVELKKRIQAAAQTVHEIRQLGSLPDPVNPDDLTALLKFREGVRLTGPAEPEELAAAADRVLALLRDSLAAVGIRVEEILRQSETLIPQTGPGLGLVILGKGTVSHFDKELGAVMLAPADTLPPEHPARSQLAEDEWFQLGWQKYLVLGPPARSVPGSFGTNYHPRPWYPVLHAVELTRQWRQVQVQREQEKKQEEERKRAGQEESFKKARMGDPFERIRQLESKLAQMEGRQDP